MPNHHITSPEANDDVPTNKHGSKYYIDADGALDDETAPKPIVSVFGKVFANAGAIPANAAIGALLADWRANGYTPGTALNAIGKLYTFRDAVDNNSIPVNQIDTNANFLQVWVKFNGENAFTPADNPVQFTPVKS